MVQAQLPGFPHGGGACTTEDDCSLGGTCTNSQCVCDVWFTGPTCAYLNLQPPKDTEQGTCGAGFNSYYSWGGRTVEVDNQYHAYVSFMCKHNSLSQWTTASSSAHFVASSPVGPYTWSPEQCDTEGVCIPTVIPWSHNTVVVESGESPQYQIWHIGDGVVPSDVWSPCFNKSEVPSERPPAPEEEAVAPLGDSPGNTAYVTASDSPNGPWVREFNNSGVSINFTGSWTTQLAGNPAPFVMPDGSVRLYFTATPCPPQSGALAPNCIAVATADSWAGPFTMNAAPTPITYPESEDPSVFRDPRGNFHLLTNVNTYHARCAQGVPCGGHAWSRDGLTFSNLTVGAFGPVITFSNGSVWRNAYVERPLVLSAPDGTPIAFYVGLGRSSYTDSCNWPQLFCTPGAQGCGPTLPPTPPPTPKVTIANNGSCLTFNTTSFPCSGTGDAAGCPVVMGSCDDPGAVWEWALGTEPSPVTSTFTAYPLPLALDVDCNNVAPHTLVKVLASGPASLLYVSEGGRVQFGSSSACLNTGQGPPVPPCSGKGEEYLQNQIQLVSCDDPTAQGWSVHVLAA